MLSEDIQKKRFDDAGNSWSAWTMIADGLIRSARYLYTPCADARKKMLKAPLEKDTSETWHFGGAILLLRGFALENMLKALLVKTGTVLAKDGKYLKVKGAHDHDLVQLAHVAAFPLTPPQQDLLKRLSICITSYGRYPIPTNWEKTKIQKLHGGGMGMPTYSMHPSDDNMFEALVKEIAKRLNWTPLL